MVVAARCPVRLQLERFLRADLPDQDVTAIESHLESCDECATSIYEISSEDPLMKDLKGGMLELDSRQQVDAMAERFCCNLPALLALEQAVDTTSVGPAPNAGSGPADEITDEIFDFLAPAEGPGEIGRLGPYRITGPIGAGGMGIVFRAEDPVLGRAIALKVMRRSLSASESARRRFLREARAVAALNDDHIVAIYQAGEDRGVLFLAMPLLRGETLADMLRRQGTLPLVDALRIAREVAEGLDVAHRQGLVHRDIKPANLWIEKPQGRVKLLDFGLSRSLEPEADLSQSGNIAGTPHYMSPEQARGVSITPLCDIFSLGCVLYHMTTGQVPFDGPDAISVLAALAAAKPTPPDRLNPEVPPAVSALILSLLARDPSMRPRSASAVIEAIKHIERAKSSQRSSRHRSAIVLMLLAAIGISGATMTFGEQVVRVLSGKGQLVIETSDPEIQVEVKRGGQLVAILDPASGRRIDLHAGEYDIELSEGKDGLRLSTRRFALVRGGREIVRVTMMDPSPSERRPGVKHSTAPSVKAAYDVRPEIDRLTARLREQPDDTAALQARADAFTKVGESDRAIADWDRAIAIEPTASRFQARGWVLLTHHDLDRALADFDESIRLDPKLARAYQGRGRVFLERQEFESARNAYDEAIQLDPRAATAYEDRAHLRQLTNDHLGAIADCDSALSLDPNLATAYAIRGAALTSLGEWGRGRIALDEFILRDPDEPWSYYHRAICRQNSTDLDGALSDFDRAIELNPEISQFYGKRGLVLAIRHDLERARADVEKALKSEPGNQEFLRLRGWVRAQSHDYEGALVDYRFAFSSRPLDAVMYADRASVEALANLHEAAESDFEAALGLDTSNAWIRARRARYLYAARGEHRKAIADCDDALRLSPGHAEASLVRGLSWLALEDFQHAIADFDQALDPHQARSITFLGPISSHYIELYRARSEARQRLGDLNGALGDLDTALALNPTDVETRVRRGRLHASRREFSEAISDFDRAIKLGRGDAEIYRDRGNARTAVGDEAGAKADFAIFDKLSVPGAKSVTKPAPR